MLDNRCTTCITYGAVCSYLESSKVRTRVFAPAPSQRLITNRTLIETHIANVRDPSIYLPRRSRLTPVSRYVRELENRLVQVERLVREVRFPTLFRFVAD